MKVFLKYSFIFDPGSTWSTKEDFNHDLGVFFESKGFRTEVVKSALEHQEEVLIYLDKLIESQIPPPPTQPQRDKSIKKTFADLTRSQDFKGRFVKENG